MSKLRLQAKTKGISSRRPTVSARAVDRLTFLHSILLPALIFLLTALIGVWAAYDRTVAWTRFSLIVGGLVFAVVIFWGGRRTLDRSTTWVLQVGGVLAPVVGILWLISRLWGDPLLHDNAAGGALAVTIPFAIAGAYSAWRRRSLAMVAVLGAGVIGAGVALALSQSRGAWLGLLAGAVVAALVGRRGLSRRSTYFALIGTATLFVAAFAIVVSVPAFERTIQTAGADGSTLGRVHVWRDMLVLI